MTLPPYNPDATCPKCGGDDVRSAWYEADDNAWIRQGRNAVRAEHIRRTCTRCGYAWPEAPMDAKEVDASV